MSGFVECDVMSSIKTLMLKPTGRMFEITVYNNCPEELFIRHFFVPLVLELQYVFPHIQLLYYKFIS